MRKFHICTVVCLLALLLGCALFLLSCDTAPVDPCAEGHTAATDAAVPATCLQEGLSEGAHCAVCHKVLTEQTPVEKLAHTPGEWTVITAPTCTQKGVSHRDCTACGRILETAITEAVTHTFGEWETLLSPTCAANGKRIHTCEGCGLTETETLAKLTHTFGTWKDVVPATCGAGGQQQRSCTACKAYETRDTAAGAHTFGAWNEIAPATCLADGSKERSCTACQHKETQSIAATGHTLGTPTVIVSASCQKEGLQHRFCIACKALAAIESIPKLTHSFGTWQQLSASTCTTKGVRTRACAFCDETQTAYDDLLAHTPATEWILDLAPACGQEGARHLNCTVCAQSIRVEKIEALSHSFSKWDTVTEPTCLADGLETRSCATCKLEEKQAIPATGHQATTPTVIRAASCATQGLVHHVCTACKGVASTEAVDATGHRFGAWKTTLAPTCMATGVREQTCANCDSVNAEVLELLAHTPTDWIRDVAASCVQEGAQHKECTACHTVLTYESVPTTAHRYTAPTVTLSPTCMEKGLQTQTCEECGAQNITHIDPLSHLPGNPVTVVTPTCSNEGVRRYDCTREGCGEVVSIETIAMTAHAYGNWTTLSASTCTMKGERQRTCADCGTTQIQFTALAAHTPGAWVTDLQPTCAKEGVRHYDCTTCQKTLAIEKINKTQHTYGDWTTTATPTCTAAGTQQRSCGACGSFDTQAIPAMAHTPGAWVTVLDATELSQGVREQACTACKTRLASEVIPALVGHLASLYFVIDEENQALIITGYRENAPAALEIPATHGSYTVTTIAAGAFANATVFTSISLPDTLTRIEKGAFDGCTAVTKTGNLTTLDGWLLTVDRASYAITIPATVKKIADGAFDECYKLVQVTNLPKLTLTGLPANPGQEIRTATSTAFKNTLTSTNGLVTYKVGSTVYLLAYTGSATKLDLSTLGVNAVYAYALFGNTTLTELLIPASLTTIGVGAFGGCRIETLTATLDSVSHVPTKHLKTLTVTGSPTELPSNFLNGCITLKSLALPSTITVVRKLALQGCVNVTSFTAPAMMMSPSIIPFFSKLVTVNINGGTSIPAQLFNGHKTLREVHIGTSIEAIGAQAFFNCYALETFVFDDIQSSNLTTIGNYQFCSNKKMTSFAFPPQVTKIPAQCFSGCSGLASVSIPEGVTRIAYEAFQNCTALTSVTIPASVVALENLANYSDVRGVFEGCTNLAEVTFAEGSQLTLISNYCFYNCKKLTSITIPATVKSIGKGAFQGSGVTSITFSNTSSWKIYEVTNLATQTTTTGFQNLGSGTALPLTSATTNATYLKTTYKDYFWVRD